MDMGLQFYDLKKDTPYMSTLPDIHRIDQGGEPVGRELDRFFPVQVHYSDSGVDARQRDTLGPVDQAQCCL